MDTLKFILLLEPSASSSGASSDCNNQGKINPSVWSQ